VQASKGSSGKAHLDRSGEETASHSRGGQEEPTSRDEQPKVEGGADGKLAMPWGLQGERNQPRHQTPAWTDDRHATSRTSNHPLSSPQPRARSEATDPTGDAEQAKALRTMTGQETGGHATLSAEADDNDAGNDTQLQNGSHNARARSQTQGSEEETPSTHHTSTGGRPSREPSRTTGVPRGSRTVDRLGTVTPMWRLARAVRASGHLTSRGTPTSRRPVPF